MDLLTIFYRFHNLRILGLGSGGVLLRRTLLKGRALGDHALMVPQDWSSGSLV